ncbi:MAG: hypothetical protein EP330_24810 [Deltaproteobacteria bacterium]|nr:MAG: hypothetical protein EP330_24810 [Deltaproteobacteria bacterium]
MRRATIAVCGDASLNDDDPRLALAEALGTALVDAGYRIVCGGRGGVMRAVARGARASAHATGGDVIGILPGIDPGQANAFVDIAIPTGLGHLRNGLIAQADAAIGIGGRAGTLSELALAWALGRPVLALRGPGWSGRLADAPLDDRRDEPVYGFDTAEEAVALLARVL